MHWDGTFYLKDHGWISQQLTLMKSKRSNDITKCLVSINFAANGMILIPFWDRKKIEESSFRSNWAIIWHHACISFGHLIRYVESDLYWVKLFSLNIALMLDIGFSVWDGDDEPADIDSGNFIIVQDAGEIQLKRQCRFNSWC